MAVRIAAKDHQHWSGTLSVRRLGALLVVLSFVMSQFVEFTLLKIGGFDFSVQKLVALVVFPVAFALMGHLRISLTLTAFALLMILSNSAAYFAERNLLDPELLSANVTVITGLVGATILYTALTQDRKEFSTLGRVWVAFAAVTSVIVLGQAVGLLPLWAVSAEALGLRATEGGGLYRGTGLRFDPNYQALVLVLGVIFARFYVKRMRFLVVLLIMLGILGTFSRMGFIVAALALVAAAPIQAWSERRDVGRAMLKALSWAAFLAAVFAGLYLAASENVRSYIDLRVEELSGAVAAPVPGGMAAGITSAEERVLLFDTAVGVISQNFVLGVGAYRAPEFFDALTSIDKTVHNTYLEMLLSGGLIGTLALLVYVISVVRALSRGRSTGGDSGDRGPILVLISAFALMAVFLTMNYNSILWFPLVIALAHAKPSSLNRRGT